MPDGKAAHGLAGGADSGVGGDLGCLLHVAGRSAERGLALEVRHVTEVLDGTLESPALGSGPR